MTSSWAFALPPPPPPQASSSSSWTRTAALAALALAAAVPLVYVKYQHSLKAQEREDALKLLRRVELIVGEVSVRLMHLENQVEDMLANEGKDDDDDESSGATSEATNSSLGSYYHFDSQGNKLKTKWDSYDVDAELERLDQEEVEGSAPSSSTSAPARKPKSRASPAMDRPKLRTAVGALEHEFEAVLEFLDDVRGDEQVKEARKALVSKITRDQLARIDALRAMLA